MRDIITRFNGSNLKLCHENNNYYAIDRDNDKLRYDLLSNWKYVGDEPGVHYLKESTKTRIINEARARASYDNEIEDFIKWYDNIYAPREEETEVVESVEETVVEKPTVDLKPILDALEKSQKTINNLSMTMESHTMGFEAAIIDGIIQKTKELKLDEMKTELEEHAKEFIDKTYGRLPSVIEIVQEGERTQTEGIFHKDFEKILKIVGQKIPLLLVGPAGSGKNHTLEQVAKALNLEFYFTNSITQEYKLTGFIDAGGNYHETEFYKAFTNGGLFFFDELDASCAEALIIVNAALANGYFDFPNGRINAHPDFRVVAAANTFGNGADMIYVGRNQLDGATLDRFAIIDFDYDEDIEKNLCDDEELYNFITAVRKAINKRQLRFIVSMRATINASKMLKAGFDKSTIIKTCITKSMTPDDINTIRNEIYITNDWTRCL